MRGRKTRQNNIKRGIDLKEHPSVIIIGGGAAGMMAAHSAVSAGAKVTLIERNEKVGRKLYITGKGRCNLTNNCTGEEVLQNVPHNPKFLLRAMMQYPPQKTIGFFEQQGLALKTERGNRVFPASDRAADVIDTLYFALKRKNVTFVHGLVKHIEATDGAATGVTLSDGQFISADRVVLATGGASYPRTGSTGDGYLMAEALGHTIHSPEGSLVPLMEDGDDCPKMQGLALKNVAVKVVNQKKKIVFQEFGELLFTHFGLSGPVILSASAHMEHYEKNHYKVCIDLKPALDEKKLDERILRDFSENRNRSFGNALNGLLPRLMIPVVIQRTGIDPDTRVHDITKAQRRALLEIIKSFTVSIAGPRPVDEAIVTRGGIKVGEIDPATMASKKCRGLYFAGEVIDVDAYTGGFNLQIAWATGYLAGKHAAEDLWNTEEEVI